MIWVLGEFSVNGEERVGQTILKESVDAGATEIKLTHVVDLLSTRALAASF